MMRSVGGTAVLSVLLRAANPAVFTAMALLPVYQRPLPEVLKVVSRNRHRNFPGSPESSFFALGSRGNMIWIAPEYDLVAVTRRLDIPTLDGFIPREKTAVQAETKN